jgi:hypothetical protein
LLAEAEDDIAAVVSNNVNSSEASASASEIRVAAGAGLTLPPECPVDGATGVPDCDRMWGMNRIKAPQLWKKLETDAPPGVTNPIVLGAIQDSGVFFDHNNLKNNVDRTQSWTGGEDLGVGPAGGNPSEDEGGGHGTHVAGTAVGEWGNGDTRGIAGVFGNGKVLSCNLLPSDRNGVPSSVISADCFETMANAGAHWVSSNSWGFINPYPADSAELIFLKEAVDELVCKEGGLFVAAAGNGLPRDLPGDPAQPAGCKYSGCTSGGGYRGVDVSDAGVLPDGTKEPGPPLKMYPAALSEELDCVLTVAASTEIDEFAVFSNWGNAVQIAAPGVNIRSDWWELRDNPKNPWGSTSLGGTSMACPHVMGAALLLHNAFPAASGANVKSCLTSTATDPVSPSSAPNADPNAILSGGVLNVLAAYECMEALVPTDAIACIPSVNVSMQYPSTCQRIAVPVESMYTVVSGTPVVTASPAGPYGPGRTSVTLSADGGATTCVTEVYVTPCAVRCKSASALTVTADAATCQAPQSAVANIVDKASLGANASLVYTPKAPYAIGNQRVNVSAKYPGGVSSASASCALNVIAPTGSSSAWKVQGKSMCMYRAVATTQEYCFKASELVTITTLSKKGCPTPPSAKVATCAWSSHWSSFDLNAAGKALSPSGGVSGNTFLKGTCRVTNGSGASAEPQVCVKFGSFPRIQLVKAQVGVSDGKSLKYDHVSIVMYNPAVGSRRPPSVPSYCMAV